MSDDTPPAITAITPATGGSATATSDRVSNDALYRELRARIIHLELQPGERLTEQGLAAEFGLSRTPVRRVLDRLANDGLVTVSAGAGASVSTIEFHALREVWALRLRIADVVGDFVRLPASPAIVARLEACLAHLDEATTPEQLAPRYDEYHEIVLDMLTNGPLRQIHDQLYAQTARAFVRMLPSLDFETELEAIRSEVAFTIDACQQRSGQVLAEGRRRYMRELIERLNGVLMIAPPPGIT